MVGPDRPIRRSHRNRHQVIPFQAPVNRNNNQGYRGRPRREEQRDEPNVLIILTTSIITDRCQTFAALQKKFPSRYSDLVRVVSGGLFNAAQFLFGPHFNQLLAEQRLEQTLSVAKDVGALRFFVNENNGPPIADEWRVQLDQFQADVLDQMDRLPKLYCPVDDDEIHQEDPFCFEINPNLSERDYLRQLDTITTNFIGKSHRVKLLFMKLVDHDSIEMDFENLDRGFRLVSGDQSAFLNLCEEKVKNMLNGKLICLPCAMSFTQKCDLKLHLRSKHADHIDMMEMINRPDTRNQNRVQELETELENSRARGYIERGRHEQTIRELPEEVALLRNNLIFDQEDRGLIVNPIIRHIPV